MRVGFQLRMVGCDQGGDAAFQKVGEEGARQGCAFLGVGTRTKLIHYDQCPAVSFLQDADDVGDMSGECRQRLLKRLLVTDIGIDIVEYADL